MINRGLTGEFEWLNKRFLCVGLSGGKDSLATCLYLRSKNIKFTPLFIETGNEFPETYNYLFNYLIKIFPNIEVIKEPRFFKENSEFKGGFEQLVEQTKQFPNSVWRNCTLLLKVKPLTRYLNKKRKLTRAKPISATGIRWGESIKRSKLKQIEETDEATWWRPIISWSEQEVVDYINSFDILPNPLYLEKGVSRVGCYPCIYARKEEIRYIAIKDNQRIDYIRDFEDRINNLYPEKPKTYFFKRGYPKRAMPIDEVVSWSMKDEVDDTDEQELSGCMKWGLCESSATKLYDIDD